MEKKEKVKIFLVILLMLIGVYFLLTLVFYQTDTSMKYEYYDIWGNYGTSSKCGEVKKGSISCLVNDNFVPVQQYSKIEKGVDKNDIWKK